MTTTGKIVAVNGNMITVAFSGAVAQNEVGYALLGDRKLMAEIVRVRGTRCDMQVFDSTTDLMVDGEVEFTGELLAAELGPGMLAQVYDGLQNPLPQLAEEAGKTSRETSFFLQRGMYIPGLSRTRKWDWHPTASVGQRVTAGEPLGWVTEGIFNNAKNDKGVFMPGHSIMVPFALRGVYTVKSLAPAGDYTVTEDVAVLTDAEGHDVPVQMMQRWPVKVPIRCFTERMAPEETLETTVRTIDTFFPVAIGGTYCIPGPFGAGKTVLQQTTARYAKVDIVISAACGERAGEVVETLKEFPEITDPKTGQSLMMRTIIICNTSSMPVASREASVYTAVTLAEYFRQMGLNVLVLADSTSRWAQAWRRSPAKRRSPPTSNRASPRSTSAPDASGSRTARPARSRSAAPSPPPAATSTNPSRRRRSRWWADSTDSPAPVRTPAAIPPSTRSNPGATIPPSSNSRAWKRRAPFCARATKSAR